MEWKMSLKGWWGVKIWALFQCQTFSISTHWQTTWGWLSLILLKNCRRGKVKGKRHNEKGSAEEKGT